MDNFAQRLHEERQEEQRRHEQEIAAVERLRAEAAAAFDPVYDMIDELHRANVRFGGDRVPPGDAFRRQGQNKIKLTLSPQRHLLIFLHDWVLQHNLPRYRIRAVVYEAGFGNVWQRRNDAGITTDNLDELAGWLLKFIVANEDPPAKPRRPPPKKQRGIEQRSRVIDLS